MSDVIERNTLSAIKKLIEIEKKHDGVLINGNFSTVAKNYGIKTKDLRNRYDSLKDKGYSIFVLNGDKFRKDN